MRTILMSKALVGMLAITLVAGGCSDTAADGRPLVVVSTSVLGDVVGDLAGEGFRVEVLMPPGVDPHEYAASAADTARLAGADLIVVNGLGLESGLGDALAAVPDGVPVLEVGPVADPLTYPGGVPDPHVWFDPRRMAMAVDVIADALAAASPERSAEVSAAADTLRASLVALDAEVVALVETVPPERRLLVSSHDFLRYFAARYGFEVVGSVIPGGSTVEQPGAGAVAALADEVAARGIGAVFAEATEPTSLADAVAAEAGGVPVVVLVSDALPDGGSYADLIRTDAMAIVDALK